MAKPMPSRRRKALGTPTIKRRGLIGRDGEHYEPASLTPATADVLDGFAALSDAVARARDEYRAEFLNKRPPGGFTMTEFTADFNRRAKGLCAPISHRAAETWFQKWVQAGEYQRAPMMLPGSDGIPRRTYVYWKAK